MSKGYLLHYRYERAQLVHLVGTYAHHLITLVSRNLSINLFNLFRQWILWAYIYRASYPPYGVGHSHLFDRQWMVVINKPHHLRTDMTWLNFSPLLLIWWLWVWVGTKYYAFKLFKQLLKDVFKLFKKFTQKTYLNSFS